MSSTRYIVALLLMGACLVSAEKEERTVDPTSAGFWGEIMAILLLVVLSGVVAGLALGLMSLDTTNLAILEIAGTPQQQKYAAKIIPIRKNGHLLLTTLLLTNTVINETLPILFDGIFSKGFMSVLASTALLVIFAEILPQSIFSKHGLAIGARFAIPVKILIWAWYIIAWPVAKLLDTILGTHTGFVYNTAEFGALVQLHDKSKHEEGTLLTETAHAVQNILDMQSQLISEIAKTITNVVLLESTDSLDLSKVLQYQNDGYTHVIVYENKNKIDPSTDHSNGISILGSIDLKVLIQLDEKDLIKPIFDMPIKPCLVMPSNTTVVEAMDELIKIDNRDQSVLVYETQNKETEKPISISEVSTINPEHTKSASCTIRKIFEKNCNACEHKEKEEEKTIGIDNVPSLTINNQLNLNNLLGIVTLSDILNQLSKTRYQSKNPSKI